MRIRLTPGRAAALAFLVTFLLCLLGSWTHALWDSDEPRFAEATREMFVRGDYLVPYLNALPRYDKPILVYWFQALGYLLFGVGETGARLPSMLGLALAAAYTARIGSRVLDPRTGLAAGLILATCVQGQVIGHAATADGILLGMVALTIDAMHARMRGIRTPGTWLQLYGGLALCFLAKGPPGWVAPLAAGLGVIAVRRREIDVKAAARTAAGLLATLLLVAAWGLPAIFLTHGDFVRVGLGHHVAERAGRGFEGHGGYAPWWLLFYLAAIPVFLFPWSAWLPQAIGFWRKGLIRRPDRTFLGYWIAVTFLLFSASVSKMPHYVLPLYPALAVLLAGHLVSRVDRGRSLFAGRSGAVSLGFVTFLGGILALLPPVVLSVEGFRTEWVSALSLSGVMIGWVAAMWILRRRGRPVVQGGLTLLATVGLFLLLLLQVMPGLSRQRLVPRAGRALARYAPAGVRRVWVDFRPDGLVFYSQRDAAGRLSRSGLNPIRSLGKGKEIVALLRSREPAAVILGADRAERIRRRQGLRRLPGRLVWKRRGYYARKGRFETVEIHLSEGAP